MYIRKPNDIDEQIIMRHVLWKYLSRRKCYSIVQCHIVRV